MMKYLAIVTSVLWFVGWLGIAGLTEFITVIFPSFCLGYILCWEIEKVRK